MRLFVVLALLAGSGVITAADDGVHTVPGCEMQVKQKHTGLRRDAIFRGTVFQIIGEDPNKPGVHHYLVGFRTNDVWKRPKGLAPHWSPPGQLFVFMSDDPCAAGFVQPVSGREYLVFAERNPASTWLRKGSVEEYLSPTDGILTISPGSKTYFIAADDPVATKEIKHLGKPKVAAAEKP